MIKFLLQTVNDRIRHDFVFELENAIEYQNWRENEIYVAYCSLEDIKDGCKFIDSDEIFDYIPVGTVEFVYAFIDKFIKVHGSKSIRPLNVPKELFKFAGRKIMNASVSSDVKIRSCLAKKLEQYRYVFIKSNDIIKSDLNSSYNPLEINNKKILPNGNYQISEYIDIETEYRCFVYNDKLIGIQYYSGNFEKFPNVRRINDMIKHYQYDNGNGKAPQSWTLDVAVTGKGETVVMECHEFYSCGLYGFNDYNALPYMFVRTFNNIKKRLLQK